MSDHAVPTPARRGYANLFSWLTTIAFNIVAPILIHSQLKDHGFSEFNAILLSGLGPLIDIAIYLAWHRRVDEFAILSLVFVGLSLVVALVGPHDAKLLLAKDSFVSGLLGVVYLATLAMPRPLMFYFGRKFATDGTPEKLAWWNGMWQYEGFRRVQRNLTIGWGLAFIVEATIRIVLVYSISADAMVTVNNTLPYAVLGGLLFWTMSYAKRARAKGEAQRATAQAANAVTAEVSA